MLRVGVIGCGGMGRDHIRRLTEKIQGAEVVAVSDVFEESARKAAEICGAKVYADSKERVLLSLLTFTCSFASIA